MQSFDLEPPFVLLEDRLQDVPAQLFRRPVEILHCRRPEDLSVSLERLEAARSAGLHAAGFFGYEAGHLLEPHLKPHWRPADTPVLWFGLFETVDLVEPGRLDAVFAGLPPPPPLRDLAVARSEAEHCAKVEEILAFIRAGDIYQANLTFPISFRYVGAPLSLYAALRARQATAYSGLVATGEHTVLSVSPELLVSSVGRRLTARPMKGTCARGAGPDEDRDAIRSLAADPKQRAENLMIVDLLRNDISRVSISGSVRTPSLFAVETYSTLHTLTSTITGQSRADLSLTDLLTALFPGGSIVGAPKIRAAEIIAALEGEPRGVYTGAIGHLAPNGDFTLNVAIRTAVIAADGRGTYGVGGGIVADSDPAAEYEEALLKARVLTALAEDYELLETLRWTPAGYRRSSAHLDRLARSAAELGFRFDRVRAEARLATAARGWRDGGVDRRVRLALARDGTLTLTDLTAPGPDARPLSVGLARKPVDRADPFLRHKTSRRAAHEHAFSEARAADFDEALLLNRAGRIADATRHTVFLRRGDQLITPPLGDGALPGVLREELLTQGRAVEGALTPTDLAGETWFLGNSLNGLRPACLVIRGS